MKIELTIDGMHCSGCVKSVTNALSSVSGVESVEVDLDHGKAVTEGAGIVAADLLRAVEAAGFDAAVAA
jgi:copper chaperone CopZ